MALIKTVQPEEAEGKVKEAYSAFMAVAGMVPKPFEMLSPSPELLTTQGKVMGYYFSHPTLGFPLLAHIRYLVALHCDYQYCINLNSGLLKNLAGLSEEQISSLSADPEKAPLEDKDKAILLFVLKAVKTPETVEHKDVDALHDLGWEDKDILDAVHHGAGMVSAGIMFKTFKMGES